jgi:hypothetical protein
MKRMAMTEGITPRLTILTLALALAGAGFLWSCATQPPASPGEAVFKFSVLRYAEPVEVKDWALDPMQSANPEGAALNITTAMQKGDVGTWLASWDASDRPNPNQAERDRLLQQWQPLKDGRVVMLGRVVAGADLVMELSVQGPQQKEEKLKLPLKRSNGQWWLTSMEVGSEFLNWENSSNKIVAHVDNRNFINYLESVKHARRQ